MPLISVIVPLALVAAAAPQYSVVAARIELQRHGREKLAAYLLGWTLAMAAFGIAFEGAAGSFGPGSPGAQEGFVELALGVSLALVGIGVLVLRRAPARMPPPDEGEGPEHTPGDEDPGPRPPLGRWVVEGPLGFVSNVTTLLVFAAAARAIGLSNADDVGRAASVLALGSLTVMPLVVPAVLAWMPGEAGIRTVAALAARPRTWGAVVTGGAALLAGAWLVTRGGIGLGWW